MRIVGESLRGTLTKAPLTFLIARPISGRCLTGTRLRVPTLHFCTFRTMYEPIALSRPCGAAPGHRSTCGDRGGGSGFCGRVWARRLADYLGQSVIQTLVAPGGL